MKKSMITLALAASLAFAASTQAQTVSLNYSPRTGDVWLDTRLGEINTYGRGDPNYFYDDMYSSYGVPRDYVRELYTDRRWAPGDIYYACALAQLLDRPCREIVGEYDRNPGQGWGALAQRLGIKPGSAQFHALKGNVGKGHGKLKAHGGSQGRGKPAQAIGAPGKGQQDRGGQGQGQGNKDKGNKDKGNGKGRGG
ncbi:MAG: hypothetical protein K0M70_01645 [Arenimonas sp.]|uniref:hypothetical protein n=1 Tax=Arenimonas sp. TaxID=1872635 RepID=UPI0025BF6230|nr:hypothetical protein [Arenimonas sp.]MBW8366551.1 hypothetical protein [Arenimonas sp.]